MSKGFWEIKKRQEGLQVSGTWNWMEGSPLPQDRKLWAGHSLGKDLCPTVACGLPAAQDSFDVA